MALRISCDICYKDLTTQPEKSYKTFILAPYDEWKVASPTKTKLIHMCLDCVPARREFYIENPWFVAPPKDTENKS